MAVLLPGEKLPRYKWTPRRILIAVILVIVLICGFMLSVADADTSFEERERARQMERWLKAQEKQAKAAQEQTKIFRDISNTLKKIEKKRK